MRIINKGLAFILMVSLLVFAESNQDVDDWDRIEGAIKMLQEDLETDEKIQKNIKEMNNLILQGLQTIDNEKKPSVLFEISPDKYLLMEIHKVSGFPVSRIVTKEEIKGANNQIHAESGNDVAGNSLPKIVFALASILYVFYSSYLLFLVGHNVRHGNYLNTLLDLGIWIIATAIMYQIYRGLL